MRCRSYEMILASRSFVLQIVVYCASSYLDYDEITSSGFIMKWYPSVCFLILDDSLSISSDENIQIPHSGLNFVWALHGVAVRLIGGAAVLECPKACSWDHNELHYSSPTNLLQEKFVEKRAQWIWVLVIPTVVREALEHQEGHETLMQG